MSLADLAHQVRAKGRGDDTMLIHMTPGEVHGLQSLAMAHGGSLTINPDTGLPEAGILKSLLPMIIGAGLSFIPGVGPLAAAAIVGAGESIRTGDIGKGIMAGLGAYGGAGLSAGIAGLGAKTAASALPQGLAGAGLEGVAATGAQAAGAGTGQALSGEALKNISGKALTQSGRELLQGGVKQGFGALGQGFQNLVANPMSGIGALGRALGPTGIAGVGGSLATAMTPEQKFNTPPNSSFTPPKVRYSPGTINPLFGQPGQSYFLGQGYSPDTRSSPYQDPQYMPPPGIGMLPQTVYAEGGPVPSPVPTFPLSGVNQPGYSQALNFSRPTELVQDYEPRIDAGTGDIVKMAGGGLSSLGAYSDGGQLLKGPGDGMSDDIPAMIGGAEPQKAALADGEFVVPADVVSGIGNGSTEAGSRALYAMMDRVRMARTGKKDQAPEIDADKYMPA